MATRRDHVMICEVLRTTPLTPEARERLARAFVEAMSDDLPPGFDPGVFIHEAMRGGRGGFEAPTIDLPWPVEITPEMVRDEWTAMGLDDAQRTILDRVGDLELSRAIDARVQVDDVDKRLFDVIVNDVIRPVSRDLLTRKATQRSREPGAWVVSGDDPNAPYGPFPDTDDATGREQAAAFMARHGLSMDDYRVVWRNG